MRKGGRLLPFTVPAAWLKRRGAGSYGGGVVVEGAAVDGCEVVGSIVVASAVAVSVAVPGISKATAAKMATTGTTSETFQPPAPSLCSSLRSRTPD
jgi:hypothetical protein